jgi:hypothetical protein
LTQETRNRNTFDDVAKTDVLSSLTSYDVAGTIDQINEICHIDMGDDHIDSAICISLAHIPYRYPRMNISIW